MLRSDSRGGSGGWVVDFGISEFEGMWIGLVCGLEVEWGEVRWGVWIGGVDRTCVWIGLGVRWGVCLGGVWIGGELRWGVWIGGVKRSTGEGKLTWVCVWLDDWTTMRERRWGELGVTRGEVDRCECSGWALFSLSLSLSLVWPENGSKWKWKCKTISESKE